MSVSSGDVEIDISGDIDVPARVTESNKSSGMSEESELVVADPFDMDGDSPYQESSAIKKLLMQLPVQLQLASPAAREWITRRRENVRPWLVFVNTQKFKIPPNVQRWTKRMIKNVDYFQSNYMFVFIILILYCLITSPMLLFAVAASLGACYILSLKNAEKKIVIGGHEIPLAHQYGAIGILSLPVFYLAGAGAVLFWVLGASFFIIAIHASLYNIESVLGSEDEPFELQMEQV
ncbi:prenylated Rab acceptor protein 1-like isoform X1 [Penaeus indicus]|uniref:prenylated Rab acceptor protein 1-like isoform X1 n=1 Tax=Penaeus indicus TaxID=29960 RepID=UPI00300D09BB